MNSDTSKGSITIDAAVVIPIFILQILLMIGLITQVLAEDNLYKKLCKDTNAGFAVLGVTELEVPFMITVGKTENYNVKKTVVYRPFVGESKELRESSVVVYIFEKSGVKYHYSGCSTMDRNSNYTRTTKEDAILRGYTMCKLCKPGGTDYFKRKY